MRATFAAKSDYVRRPLSAAAAATIVPAIERAPGSGSLLLDSYGGAINRVPKAATAFVHRDMLCSLQYLAYWNAPRAGRREPRVAALLLRGHAPVRVRRGVRQLHRPRPGRAAGGVLRQNFRRLVSIKRRYDPANVFRFRQSIPLQVPS